MTWPGPEPQATGLLIHDGISIRPVVGVVDPAVQIALGRGGGDVL